MSTSEDQKLADEWAAALGEDPLALAAAEEAAAEAEADALMASQSQAQQAPLDELTDSSTPISDDERRKLDTIMDIPVTISMEVGRSQISIRNLLLLNQGSVVELDQNCR